MSDQIVERNNKLTSSIYIADKAINEMFEHIVEEEVLRSKSSEQRALSQSKRAQIKKDTCITVLICFLPLTFANLFIWSLIESFTRLRVINDHAGLIMICCALLTIVELTLLNVLSNKRRFREVEQFIKEAEVYELRAEEKHLEIEKFILENEKYFAIIPQKYRYPKATNYLKELFELDRARSLPEAYDKLENQLHRWFMEAATMEIINNQVRSMAVLNDIEFNTTWM